MALNDEDFMTIEQLGDKFPQDWISVKGLWPYIKRLGMDLVGVEIGTCRAESTVFLLDKCSNIKKIYTVDPYKAYQDWNGEITQETVDKFRVIAQTNLKKYGDQAEMVRMESVDFAKKCKKDKIEFDFIFVDGDHSYEGTLADCEAYYPLLKNGGVFCGHDYQSLDSVRQAVNDFRKNNNISAPLNLSTNSAFFWNK